MKRGTVRCSVCGEPPVTARIVADGAVVWQCQNHLEGEARALYRDLRDDGWDAPPPRTVH
ncbi:MAG TPA: hypothetical protein VMU87_16165 [Stellaceae bacterium]|nr:hypothetical protein [Stellaceae bacterium]